MLIVDQYGAPADYALFPNSFRPAQVMVTKLANGEVVSFLQVDNTVSIQVLTPYLAQALEQGQ